MDLCKCAIKSIIVITILSCITSDVKCLKFDDDGAAEPNVQNVANITSEPAVETQGRQSGRNLFDFIGLGTGGSVDPFLRRTNEKCLNGELAECFKSQALNSFDEIFVRESYDLTPHVRVLRVPQTQLRSLEYEPYEFTNEARDISESVEWSELMKFGLRKAERFLKSHVFEISIPEEFTEGGKYAPRFIDEISDELDVIEDKKAPFFLKHKVKKMFIPMLIILKLFKLKLLLFLPFILGITGLKKILGLGALLIPGIIGYFKLCRPGSSGYNNNHIYSESHVPQYSYSGLGGASYNNNNPLYSKYSNGPSNTGNFNGFYRDNSDIGSSSSDGGVRFADDAQDLAYRNSKISSTQ